MQNAELYLRFASNKTLQLARCRSLGEFSYSCSLLYILLLQLGEIQIGMLMLVMPATVWFFGFKHIFTLISISYLHLGC